MSVSNSWAKFIVCFTCNIELSISICLEAQITDQQTFGKTTSATRSARAWVLSQSTRPRDGQAAEAGWFALHRHAAFPQPRQILARSAVGRSVRQPPVSVVAAISGSSGSWDQVNFWNCAIKALRARWNLLRKASGLCSVNVAISL